MPNRVIRDWTDSEKINDISAHAEVFIIRLMMKADDYGSYYGNLKLLKANLFPLRIDTVRDADISRWIAECEKAGLILVYTNAGKDYLRIINFGQRMRNMKNRFPDCSPQLAADCRNSPPETRIETEIETRDEKELRSPENPLIGSNLFRQPVIPTKQDVWRVFSQLGASKEMAKKFYEKYEGTGWYYNNSPITNFAPLASKYISTWKTNDLNKVGAPQEVDVGKSKEAFDRLVKKQKEELAMD